MDTQSQSPIDTELYLPVITTPLHHLSADALQIQGSILSPIIANQTGDYVVQAKGAQTHKVNSAELMGIGR